jgi:hypothetical protein
MISDPVGDGIVTIAEYYLSSRARNYAETESLTEIDFI